MVGQKWNAMGSCPAESPGATQPAGLKAVAPLMGFPKLGMAPILFE
jgi:hypothetical protein